MVTIPTSDQLIPADTFWRALAPARAYFSPELLGLEHITPNRPTVFVANHALYGLFEMLVGSAILKETGVRPRGLLADFHLQIPGWRKFMQYLGAVAASRANMEALLNAGESPFTFPGGLRELAKRKGEAYKLMWGEHVGWVRIAVEHGCTITPIAVFGPEHAFTIMWDANDMLNMAPMRMLARMGVLGRVADAYGVDINELPISPLARGIGLSPIPRPERCYFSICAPIETAEYKDRVDDRDAMMALRDQVSGTLEAEFERLERRRSTDENIGFLRKLLTD
ncbi:lysophospholipid acyltransferase family protein [Enhygromyxa salina]|uniref:Diacylglycerol acyltransferase n=1 Tax=Enhygromyxa salina TaxID=215803 RepID=A0A2S9YN28_9BACT|nr:lysophospholipid acyltransferase family protein [Enhygromyxa salina]PRQ06492.1 Diacylglycerol acyltransferase [Enhygromyxa salina]